LHRRDRREEVHADRPVRARARHLGDAQRRRVRGEDRARPDDGDELGEQRLLGGEVLDDALDDEIDAGERGPFARDHQAVEGGVARLGGELAPPDRPCPGLLDALARVERAARRGLAQDDVEAGEGRHLRNPGAHEPGAHDANRLDVGHFAPPLLSAFARSGSPLRVARLPLAPGSRISSPSLAAAAKSLTRDTIWGSVASWPNTSATPSSLRRGTSACGITPPTTTGMSSSRSRSSAAMRAQMVSCAPDRMDRPMTSTLSCAAVATIASGDTRRPV